MGDTTSAVQRDAGSSVLPLLCWGMLLVLVAAFGAMGIRGLHGIWPGQQERVVKVAALVAIAGVVVPVGLYLGIRRRAAMPRRVALLVLASVGTALLAFYLTWVSHYVEYPADILMWAEGDFVNDIIKFRVGYPLYTSQVNNDSFHYTPGAQLTTYGLAWLVGIPDSIPVYRLIQLGYGLAAAVVAVCCYWRLRQLSGTNRLAQERGLWGAVALPLFFLIATNCLTNLFAHNLHDDALAQLVSVMAYWLLLDYALRRRRLTLVWMALIPAAGYFVKQSLGIWIPLYGIYLLFFDAPRSWFRIAGLTVGAFAVLGVLIAGCLAIWREPFWYWTVTMLSSKDVSPLRGFVHLLDAWVYYAIGLFAGFVLLRGPAARQLWGLWLVWLLLLGTETYTSGIEWMLNHMGPGCLVAGVWFLAGLTRLWSADRLLALPGLAARAFLRAGLAVAVIGLAYAGMGLVWMPINPLPADAQRYLAEIEKEFVGLPSDKVLMDLGAWIHARDRVVMKDRAPCIAVRGASHAGGDFSGILGRLEDRYYQKILVHNLDAPMFWYDDGSRWWLRSSGIRQALHDNYQEVGRIRAVQGESRFIMYPFEPLPWTATRYGFQDITILVPKPRSGSVQP
jgi:hypothetical protein